MSNGIRRKRPSTISTDKLSTHWQDDDQILKSSTPPSPSLNNIESTLKRSDREDLKTNEPSLTTLNSRDDLSLLPEEIDQEVRIEKIEKQHISNQMIKSGLNPCLIDQSEIDLQLLEDPELFWDSEDSENERTLHTIGDVPLKWYDDFDHIGYDLDGEMISRPKGEDEIDRFIALNASSKGWRTVYDEKTGKRTIISDRDMAIIQSLQSGIVSNRYDAEKWFIPVSTMNPDLMPTKGILASKKQFVPSRWESKRLRKIAFKIRKGFIKIDQEQDQDQSDDCKFFSIWDQMEHHSHRMIGSRIPPPHVRPPLHAESYNPSLDQLFTLEEKEQWEQKAEEERFLSYLPKKYPSLRHVPAFKPFQMERFRRCLDMYLCTRVQRSIPNLKNNRKRLIEPLPKPSELRPFPTTEMLSFIGHNNHITSISLDPLGQWLVSGSRDNTVRLWEVKTSRCVKIWQLKHAITCVAWNPNPSVPMIAVSTQHCVSILIPPILIPDQLVRVNEIWKNYKGGVNSSTKPAVLDLVSWLGPRSKQDLADGWRAHLEFNANSSIKFISQLTWHPLGNYLVSISPSADSASILIHQISEKITHKPFHRSKGRTQSVRFHPFKAILFIATLTKIRIYDLMNKRSIKTCKPKTNLISSMDIHPGGDHLIIGSYDHRVLWFDLDLGMTPYKTFNYHKKAVTSVRYHKKYPLFASASDDGMVHIHHSTVYDDLTRNPMIVPLKILRGHSITDNKGVLNIVFHPSQPWIFTCGADHTIRLFVQ